MHFSEIILTEKQKEQFISGVKSGRMPHAQLFVGPEGSGTLAAAVAYAEEVILFDCKASQKESNFLKFKKIIHPDIHFIFPTVATEVIKKNPKSSDFLDQWRKFVLEQSYGSLFDWYSVLEVENKQGIIRVEDAAEVLKTISLKAYEGGFKVVIIWMAEKMNIEASNKLLKILEEPPEKTVFILITENEKELLPTITSRCQVVRFNKLETSLIAKALEEKEFVPLDTAFKVAKQAQGNYNKALQLIKEDENLLLFEEWFVFWVRAAYKAKKNAAAIHELLQWSEKIAKLGRETQKKFLSFCSNLFRQALLLNYEAKELVNFEPLTDFGLEKLAPFVNGANIIDIMNEINDASYHIERNGNGKLILTDLSIKLTRLIHKK